MARLTVDGVPLEFEPGRTILQLALSNDLYVPSLCFHPDLPPAEECGLCAVEIEGRGVVQACVTLAEDGMLLCSEGDEDVHHIHAVARDVYDVSGAGDIVTATLAVCLAAGGTEFEASVVANYAAGVEVSKSGVVPVRPDEILAALDADHDVAE